MELITNFTSELWNSGKFLIGLGGDHDITFPFVKAPTEQGIKAGIIERKK
ncbi:arginase family protein [Sporosarcina sp. G11-34]|nr:arginase family protein [Sporosarcina sp. G11-34]